jgi:hypothetical protein
LREKLDKLRGDIARSKFISRIIEDVIRKYAELPTTGQSWGRPGQPVGKNSIYGGPTDG